MQSGQGGACKTMIILDTARIALFPQHFFDLEKFENSNNETTSDVTKYYHIEY
jgi:hypothetical protein